MRNRVVLALPVLLLAFGGLGCGEDEQQASAQLRALCDGYPTMSAPQIKASVDALSLWDHYVIAFAGQEGPAFRNLGLFLLGPCQIDPGTIWTELKGMTPMGCQQAQSSWDLIASIGIGGPQQSIEMGRNQVLIYLKCQSGEIDEGSCGLYYSLQGQVASAHGQTSQQIIDNIGGKCRVGADPGCYP